MAAEIQQLVFRHIADILAHYDHLAGIRTQKPGRHLHNQGFSGAALAEKDLRLSGPSLERYSLQHFAIFKTDVNVFERDDRLARDGFGELVAGLGGRNSARHSTIIDAKLDFAALPWKGKSFPGNGDVSAISETPIAIAWRRMYPLSARPPRRSP